MYAYATRSTRRIWTGHDPTRYLDLPARDEQKRTRVAPVPEARDLLRALPDDVAMPYALAIGAGLRRSELARLDWADVLWEANKLLVRRSKSEAGTLRRAPVSNFGMRYLREEHVRQGRPSAGPVLSRSVLSGHLQRAADKAWKQMNAHRASAGRPPIARLTLHEGRHTYASMLMAAAYTIVEIMAFIGHADLAATQRYLKKLPQPNELDEAARLHSYEAGFAPPQTA
ncbi:MAG: tyrosine-type recombinase/integrase [Solirubrobacteraceae bacterium]